jgi:hypothetical protein
MVGMCLRKLAPNADIGGGVHQYKKTLRLDSCSGTVPGNRIRIH